MKKKTSTKKTHNKHKNTLKQKQRGGNCGCSNTHPLFGTIKGGNFYTSGGMGNKDSKKKRHVIYDAPVGGGIFNTLPSNAIPLNTFNNDPTTLTISSRINGGKSRKYKKYQKKQTPFYPKIRGGDALLGSSYNPISSFGTTSGIPFSSNTLFGISNQASANGIADIPFFGKHNLPLV